MLDWIFGSRAYRLKYAREDMSTALRAWRTSTELLRDITCKWTTHSADDGGNHAKVYSKLAGTAEKRAKRAFNRLWRCGYYWHIGNALNDFYPVGLEDCSREEAWSSIVCFHHMTVTGGSLQFRCCAATIPNVQLINKELFDREFNE